MRYACFDIDGVLISSDRLHYDALNQALTEVAGVLPIPWPEHGRRFKALPTAAKLAILVDEGRLAPEDVDRVAEAKQKLTVPLIESLPYDPTKEELFRALKADGWRLGCCSNAVQKSVDAMVRRAGVRPYLDFALSNESAAPKPAPDLYLLAAKGFGVPPEKVVVVEDGAPGILAAERAGCKVVKVAGPDEVTLALVPRLEAACR